MRQLNEAIEAVAALRKHGARVHCITNAVAQEWTANVLLACGVAPSMTVSPREASDFTSANDALLINLGTLDESRETAIRNSLEAAAARTLPVVLDPVKCEMSPHRAAFARLICDHLPVILKANLAESKVLGPVATACRVTTGQADRIEFHGGTFEVGNGDPVMDRVVAMGCALGALIAALCVHAPSPQIGALAGLVWFGVAGEAAARSSGGPGSFRPAFIDRLTSLNEDQLRKEARVQ